MLFIVLQRLLSTLFTPCLGCCMPSCLTKGEGSLDVRAEPSPCIHLHPLRADYALQPHPPEGDEPPCLWIYLVFPLQFAKLDASLVRQAWYLLFRKCVALLTPITAPSPLLGQGAGTKMHQAVAVVFCPLGAKWGDGQFRKR